MGRDKALLPYRGATLLHQIATIVEGTVGNVAIIGDPNRYSSLPYPVYPDILRGLGPLGGIYTALHYSKTEWNLIVACDMPGLTSEVLQTLVHQATQTAAECVVATGPNGEAEPLCAVYHRSCLPVLARAIGEKRLKMKDIVAELRATAVPVDLPSLVNINTPADWTSENL